METLAKECHKYGGCHHKNYPRRQARSWLQRWPCSVRGWPIKEAGDPSCKIARPVPPVWRAGSATSPADIPPIAGPWPQASASQPHVCELKRMRPGDNPAIGDPQGFPQKTAVIPVWSDKASTHEMAAAATAARSPRQRRRQTACKPGSVPPPGRPMGLRRRRRPFLWDARHRAPRATDPSGGAKARPAPRDRSPMPAAPIWSCSRWGFPCRRRCRRRGALLPHHFTLAARRRLSGRARRCTFCGTFPGVAPAGRYPAPYLRGARTFLSPHGGGERPSCRLAIPHLDSVTAFVKGPTIKFQGLVVTPTVAANSFLTLPPNSGLTSRVVLPALASTAVAHAI